MSKKDYNVGPTGDGTWNVKRTGADRSDSIHPNQADAIARGKELAQKSHGDLTVRGRDGKVRSKDSYGNDPPSIRDREH